MSTETSVKPPQPKTDNATLFVSLYVVLLAFFIMLNVISENDEKRRKQVIESVNKAFTVPETFKTIEFSSESGAESAVEQFYGELESTLESLISLDNVSIFRSGNTLISEIPTKLLFEDTSAVIRPASAPFIEQLTALLSKWQQGLRIDMEILVGYEKSPDEESNNTINLGAYRSGALARFLEQGGVDAKSLAAGLRGKHPELTLLTFSANAPEDTRIEINAQAGSAQ